MISTSIPPRFNLICENRWGKKLCSNVISSSAVRSFISIVKYIKDSQISRHEDACAVWKSISPDWFLLSAEEVVGLNFK